MRYTYSFEKLQVWVEAKELAKHIYKITKKFPNDERFGLISQLRRASISIASNIAEGVSRNTNKEQKKQANKVSTIIHPTYFPSIAHYVVFAKSMNLVFEMEDNFQKQTYRNRTYIYGANGKLMFNVPVRHNKAIKHQSYKDIKVANETLWQRLHWKSLESAYRTSPYFEYYEHELKPIFEKKYTFLMDLNLDTIQILNDCLQLEIPTSKTQEYIPIVTEIKDYRKLVNVKKEPDHGFEAYTQVFADKHGFIPNLSILDLLFNEGTNALSYLEQQTVL